MVVKKNKTEEISFSYTDPVRCHDTSIRSAQSFHMIKVSGQNDSRLCLFMSLLLCWHTQIHQSGKEAPVSGVWCASNEYRWTEREESFVLFFCFFLFARLDVSGWHLWSYINTCWSAAFTTLRIWIKKPAQSRIFWKTIRRIAQKSDSSLLVMSCIFNMLFGMYVEQGSQKTCGKKNNDTSSYREAFL